MATSRTLKLSILADVDDLNKKLKAANNDVEDSSNKLVDFGKAAGVAFAAAAAAAGTMAIKLGVDAVKSASDLSETVSKVSVIFGSSSKAINAFAETAATKLGQTKQQALDAAATFATFGKSAGLSGDDLVKFSTGFTKLASDLASFNNTSPEQAINAIGAALRGEAEPLRAYGVLLDDASLRQAALELGIVSTTKNALTPQQKVLAAQELIYRQTAAAQGDFERTSDGLANKQRILTAQLENMKTVIGNALLPIVLELFTVFSTKVLPIFQNITDSIGKGEGLAGSFEYVANVISKVFVPVFNGVKSAFGSISDAISDNKASFIAFGKIIAEYVAPVIGTVFGGALKVVGAVAGGIINIIADIAGVIAKIVGGAIDGINAIIKAYNAIPVLPNIPTISKPSISVPTVSVPSTHVNVPTVTVPTINVPTGGGSSGGSGGTSSAASSAASASTSMGTVVTGSFGAGSFRMGEAASMPTQVVVNVNAPSAIDQEGFSRAVVDALNQSTYRGTGGSSGFQVA